MRKFRHLRLVPWSETPGAVGELNEDDRKLDLMHLNEKYGTIFNTVSAIRSSA